MGGTIIYGRKPRYYSKEEVEENREKGANIMKDCGRDQNRIRIKRRRNQKIK